jgi:hypothetical protein
MERVAPPIERGSLRPATIMHKPMRCRCPASVLWDLCHDPNPLGSALVAAGAALVPTVPTVVIVVVVVVVVVDAGAPFTQAAMEPVFVVAAGTSACTAAASASGSGSGGAGAAGGLVINADMDPPVAVRDICAALQPRTPEALRMARWVG